MQHTVSRTEQDDIGTLMAKIIQAISTLLRQMVALYWGMSPSVTCEMFPGMPGFQVPAGTSLFRKFPVAVDPIVETELGALNVGSTGTTLSVKVVGLVV